MEASVNGYLEGATIHRVAGMLLAGGIAVLPTDTIYGFHCLASRTDSIAGILACKGKGVGEGLIVLAADIEMVDMCVREWPGNSRAYCAHAWPAPFTAVLPASDTVPPILRPRGAVALRVPALGALRSVVRVVGEPLVSTSVNVTGQEPMTRIDEIKTAFPGLGAYMAQRGRPSTLPSTVVDFTSPTPRLIREGRYRWCGSQRAEGEKS